MQSNITIDKLEIFKHADSRVAIVVTDGKAGYEGVLHAFLTNDSLAAWLKEKRAEHPERDIRYLEDYLATAVDFAIWNDVEGLSLHSVVDASYDVAREDMGSVASLVECFVTMNNLRKGKLSMADAADTLKNKTVYYIGNMPEEGKRIEKKDIVFGKTLSPRRLGQEQYEAILAFLTNESAIAYAGDGVPVSQCKLNKLAEIFNYEHPIIIETDRSFAVEIAQDALRN